MLQRYSMLRLDREAWEQMRSGMLDCQNVSAICQKVSGDIVLQYRHLAGRETVTHSLPSQAQMATSTVGLPWFRPPIRLAGRRGTP